MGGVLGGDEKSTDMALFHRNAAVIDSSGEPVLLSPPLPCQNMSQSRLVTFTKVGGGGAGGETHHAKEEGKFRMTRYNKQSQEVGSQRHWWLCRVSLTAAGRNREFMRRWRKAHKHVHGA